MLSQRLGNETLGHWQSEARLLSLWNHRCLHFELLVYWLHEIVLWQNGLCRCLILNLGRLNNRLNFLDCRVRCLLEWLRNLQGSFRLSFEALGVDKLL